MSDDNKETLAKCCASISLISAPLQGRQSTVTFHSECTVRLFLRPGESFRMSGTDSNPYSHGELLFYVHLDKVKSYGIPKTRGTSHKIVMANGRSFQLDFTDDDDFRAFVSILWSALESLKLVQKPLAVGPTEDFLFDPELSPRKVSSENTDEVSDEADSDIDANAYMELQLESVAAPRSAATEEINDESDDDDYDKIESGNMCPIPAATDPNGPEVPKRPPVQVCRPMRIIEPSGYDDLTRATEGEASMRRSTRPLPSPKPPATLPPTPAKRTAGKFLIADEMLNDRRTNGSQDNGNQSSSSFTFTQSARNARQRQDSIQPREIRTTDVDVRPQPISPKSSAVDRNNRFNPVAAELAEALSDGSFRHASSHGSRRNNNNVADEYPRTPDVSNQHFPASFNRLEISPSIVRTRVYNADGRSNNMSGGIEPLRYRDGDIIVEIVEYVSTPMYASSALEAPPGGIRDLNTSNSILAQRGSERAGYLSRNTSREDEECASALQCDTCKPSSGGGTRKCRNPWSCASCTLDNACSKKKCDVCANSKLKQKTSGSARVNVGGIQQHIL